MFHVSCFALLQQDSALPIQLAQQLSADAAATLEVLIKYTGALQGECGLSYEIVWLLVRPVLRVILWLLPEHVMTAADGTGPCTSTSSNNSNSSSSGNSSSNFTGVLYVTSVATVSWMCAQGLLQPQLSSAVLKQKHAWRLHPN
jgi:hypothetical protein